LTSDGICVLAGIGSAGPNQGQMWRIARGLGAALWSGVTDHKFARYITKMDQADLKFLSDLMAQGKLTPFVEKTYRLSETAEALRYFGEGHARGKLVIKIDADGSSASKLKADEYVFATDLWTVETMRSDRRTREVNH
jgi:NADPH:quinone reductase-like Zn-dependent oxidoreductase